MTNIRPNINTGFLDFPVDSKYSNLTLYRLCSDKHLFVLLLLFQSIFDNLFP